MRRLMALLLTITLAAVGFSAFSLAEENTLTIEEISGTVRPGKALVLTFTVPEEGTAYIWLMQSGRTVQTLWDNMPVTAGINRIWWNGTQDGIIPDPGNYELTLQQGAKKVSQPVAIGTVAPFFSVAETTGTVTPETPLTVTFIPSVEGTVTTGIWFGDVWSPIENIQAVTGENTVTRAPANRYDGTYYFTLTLTDILGYPSDEIRLPITLSGFGSEPEETEIPEEAEELPEEPEELPEETEELPDTTEEAMDFAEETEEVAELDELTEVAEEVPEETSGEHEVVLDEADNALTQEEMAAHQADIVYTPSLGSPYTTDTSMNYWTLPMDISDESKVWEMLMQPMTVVSGDEKSQTVLRSQPDSQSAGVGLVTQETQGVHVISQTEDGWSLVECYSSSFYGTKIKAWNMLVQGYVKTSQLKQVKPADDYAIVVDKLTQRLYLFRDGKLFTTLLVSTGLANAKQPFNETRSGEFILTSAVGDFASDNMTCGMALRFNSGDLLHEVPSIANKDGSKNYGYTEPKLGEKASHGCIRVQRAKTPEGVNMAWLWKNRVRNTKIVIWEDWQGRQIPTPADDFTVYYNPNGGRYYHSQETCSSAQGKTFSPITYGDLCDNPDYTGLKTCTSCTPVLRREKIEEINQVYAPGGDHDPIMTEARAKDAP